MKTKNLLLCLLFLVLGTTTAFADKYYVPGGRVQTKDLVVGKKYMLYNTAFEGTENRTGFIYNNGTGFGIDRHQAVDNLIYNEAFVFVLHDCGDSDATTFYIETVSHAGYVNVEGYTSASPVKMKIFDWDTAQAGDIYTMAGNGTVTINRNNNADGINQAVVRSHNDSYSIVLENAITFNKNHVFVISNETQDTYFSVDADGFDAGAEGHPFAFYECELVTAEKEFKGTGTALQDLHIFSRCDLYSAQKTYGYVQEPGKISTSNTASQEGAFDNLIDGNLATNNVVGKDQPTATHYYQLDLTQSVQTLRLFMQRRSDGLYAPVKFKMQGAVSDPTDGNWEDIALPEVSTTTELATKSLWCSPIIDLGKAYRYIRIVSTESTTVGNNCMALAELYALPADKDIINNTLEYMDNSLPVVASVADYTELVNEYNRKVSAMKLLSGVPISGNKYRIYADAYSGGAYVPRDLRIVYDDEKSTHTLVATDSYLSASAEEKASFEWYCEEANGKLVFRNAKYSSYYLSNAIVSTVAYGWTINTNLTQHHGVPLKNSEEQYLALYNTGEYWQGDVQKTQDQRVTSGEVVVRTEKVDTVMQDVTLDITHGAGLCTDFVFLPADYTASETKVTIVADELTTRNAVVKVAGSDDAKLPFSRVFSGDVSNLKVESTVGEYHTFSKFYKLVAQDGKWVEQEITPETAQTITDGLYGSQLESGDTIHVRFEVKEPFTKSTEGNIKLYQLVNKRPVEGVAGQQARPHRASANDVVINNDEQVSHAQDVYYYASFKSKSERLGIIYDKNELTAKSLFYFTNDEGYTLDSINVYVHSAVTPYKYNHATSWTETGKKQFVAPNKSGLYIGYTISNTQLNAINNLESDAWCTNYDNGGSVLQYYPNDNGSAWDFEPVTDDDAKTLLKAYINDIAPTLLADLNEKLDNIATNGLDEDKINSAIEYIEGIQEGITSDSYNVTELVGKAQGIHMLEHEKDYALQALPELTNEAATPVSPTWYYLKNVYGTAEVSAPLYAKYIKADERMTFSTETSLANLFYFAGDRVENNAKGYKEEYLKAHIHNFKALNLKSADINADSTVVGKNKLLFSDTYTANPQGGATEITTNAGLAANISWEVRASYDFSEGKFYSGWGSSLIASGDQPTIDGGSYWGGFQLFLQSRNNGRIVFRGATTGSNDNNYFSHTEGRYSKIDVLLSYANAKLTVSVTNSVGETETKTFSTINNQGVNIMNDISTLSAALSPNSTFTVSANEVAAMNWTVTTDQDDENDIWYMLPSSNTTYKGVAIVMEDADDTNNGWAYIKEDDKKEIFVANGTNDNATWQFEKVTDFDNYINEFIELYKIDDYAIYDKEYQALYDLAMEKADSITKQPNGENEATYFNEVVKAFREYTGPQFETLKAPKPDKFYTIFPASDVEEVEIGVHVDKAEGEISTNEANRASKIKIFKGEQVNASHEEYNSRGVWCFEGTADGDYLQLTDLKLKNLHTQSYLKSLDANGALLKEDGTLAVTLEPKGGTKVAIRVGDKNMLRSGAGAKSIIGVAPKEYANDKVAITFDRNNLQGIAGDGTINNDQANQGFVCVDKGSVTLESSDDIQTHTGDVMRKILLINQNATASPEMVHTFTLSNLGAGFTFNHIALDIHALNNYYEYQPNSGAASRLWNVKVEVGETAETLTEFFTLTDIDIAAGVGTSGDVHQKWGLAGNEFTTNTGDLVVKLTITAGTSNVGCFFGLSEVALSNVGDVWYIKEIENPNMIFHETQTNTNGHSTLMLGFDSKIPTGVEAFYATDYDGVILDEFYLSMSSYGEPTDEKRILPANTPVILRNTDQSIESRTFRFYYSDETAEQVTDPYMHGSLYFTPVRCKSFDAQWGGSDVNIYMLHKDNAEVRMYWVWENYNENGEMVGENMDVEDGEGYVLCHANKAFIVLPHDQVGNLSLFSFRFPRNGTTAIEEVDAEGNAEMIEAIFDLQGRKLNKITQPGIYIINGKKVYVK